MSSENEVVSIHRDQYEKMYLEQRQRVHVTIVQQLIAKSEARKQLLLTKSTDIIENFVQYRDEFLKSMPPELKAMKVKDYINKGIDGFQDCIKKSNEAALTNFYKVFQQEFEKATKTNRQTSHRTTELNIQCPQKDVNNDAKEGLKTAYIPEKNDKIVDITNKIENKQAKAKRVETTPMKKIVAKYNGKVEEDPAKNSKKRKWDNYASSSKENNRPNINHSTSKQKDLKASAAKILLSEKKNLVMTTTQTESSVSPKKPWMP